MFSDSDSLSQNSQIVYEILNDYRDLLRPRCQAFEVNQMGLHTSAINCSMCALFGQSCVAEIMFFYCYHFQKSSSRAPLTLRVRRTALSFEPAIVRLKRTATLVIESRLPRPPFVCMWTHPNCMTWTAETLCHRRSNRIPVSKVQFRRVKKRVKIVISFRTYRWQRVTMRVPPVMHLYKHHKRRHCRFCIRTRCSFRDVPPRCIESLNQKGCEKSF